MRVGLFEVFHDHHSSFSDIACMLSVESANLCGSVIII